MNFKNNILWPAVPLAVACLTIGFTLFSCADKDIETDDSNGKALVAFNVSETQDQAQAGAKSYGPISRAAFTRELALQDLTPEDLTMQKLPVQGKAGAGLCLIETTVAGVPSQLKAEVSTRANITNMATLQHFSTTAFYGSSDTTLEPWFYDKETKEDGTLVSPMYWDWFKNHACFYAVYPRPYSKLVLSPESHTGTPYVDFTVESDVKNQKDLMTACSGNVHSTIGTMSATAPRTDLTFRHALTAVRFKVGENLSYSKHITKVEIVGAKSKGKYTLPTDKNHTGSWDASSLSAPATFTLGGDGTVSVSTSEAVNNIIVGKPGDNYVFYMIPQTLTGVQARFYFDGAITPAITVSLPGKWKPGTTKTYALSQNTSTWLYELTVTPPAPAEYNANATGNYKIESYREDPVSHTKQAVPWEVVGYDTNGDGTFSMTEPLPSWFTGLTTTSGNGSITTTGETGVANLVPEAASTNKLAAMNAALKLNVKGSTSDYYDLSTHDIKGNTTLRNTANCYVISHPGFYKIPLVYGNAIKNGGKNESAYQTSNTGSVFLTHFKDHDNKNITDPWIEKTNSGANNGVNDVKVVWADEAGLVQFGATKIVRDASNNAFVQFEVPAATIKNGNAVIAVMKNGTVVWSWHLWFIHDDALNTTACWNYQNKRYDFTQEALGMKYASWMSTSYDAPRSIKVKVRQTKGQTLPATRTEAVLTITQNPGTVRQGITTFYQFGRKDALPGTDAIAQGSYSIDFIAGDHSLGYAIQHPENMLGPYHLGGVSTNDWCNLPYHNLWSMENTTTGYNDNAVVKTIYDPCPAGFHMPASNAFTGFTTNGYSGMNASGAWDHGWNFNNKISSPDATVYFPASGYRHDGSISPSDVGSQGRYWTVSPGDWGSYSAYFLYFQSSHMVPHSASYRMWGFSVRPVAEPKTRVTPKLPGSTEEDWSNNEDLDAGDIDI